jgi:hypothetical protein
MGKRLKSVIRHVTFVVCTGSSIEAETWALQVPVAYRTDSILPQRYDHGSCTLIVVTLRKDHVSGEV